jgi:hypothetical protein
MSSRPGTACKVNTYFGRVAVGLNLVFEYAFPVEIVIDIEPSPQILVVSDKNL